MRVLEEHLKDLAFPGEVFTLSAVLLSIAKELSAFLSAVSSLSLAPAYHPRQRGRQPQNAWLGISIANLRVECHRYSWAVLQISTAMGKRAAPARHHQPMMAADEGRAIHSIEHSTVDYKTLSWLNETGELQGPATGSSISSNHGSVWSGSEVTSPSSSTTPPGARFER